MRRLFFFWISCTLLFIPHPAASSSILGFILVDAITDQDIGPLSDNNVINIATTGSVLNIRAEVDTPAGSVSFDYDGATNFSTENYAPFALAGDRNGDYAPWTPVLGSHSLMATAYTGNNRSGIPGVSLSINFTVIDDPDPANQPPVVDMLPRMDPDPVRAFESATVSVIASDPDGDPLTYLWQQVAGPGSATIADATSASTQVSFSIAGAYTFEVGISDAEVTVSELVSITVGPPIVSGDGTVQISGELQQWHKLTLTLDGPYAFETGGVNPFLDYRMDVTFTNGGVAYVVPGYFAADGDAANTSATEGTKWRAHISPELSGTWDYSISFQQGPDVAVNGGGQALAPYNGISGSFTITDTDKTGRDHRAKGRLAYVDKHHLQFMGSGEYFLKTGADSPENFLAYADFDNTPDLGGFQKTWAPHAGDWNPGDPVWKNDLGKNMIGALNYLSGKGMNAFSFLTLSAQGDDGNVFMWVSPDDPSRYDCSKLDQWEIVFSHADVMGLFMHFKTQERENDQLLDGGELGTERRLYYRELIARFSHHLALVWNLGEENTNTDDQRKDFSDFIRGLDPYDHLIVVHTFPFDKDLVYTPLLGYPNFDGISLHSEVDEVHNDVKNWIDQSVAGGRPWVVSNEEQIPSLVGVLPDAVDYWHDDIRTMVLWGTIMAGGAGVEYYFGYDYPQSDLTCENWRSRDHMWDLSRYAQEFFVLNDIPFWDMQSDDALSDNPDDYLFYKDSEVYVVYLENGGTTNLDLSTATGTFEVKWYDPKNGGGLQEAIITQVTGGSVVNLGVAPYELQRDWVVLVRLIEGLEPDLQAPSIPDNLTATAISISQIDLSWDTATDDVNVTAYEVFRDALPIALITNTSYADIGLEDNTTYAYSVKAIDGADNRSDESASAAATTPEKPNGIPTIDTPSMAVPNPVVVLNTAQLSLAASDPENDPLTYSWRQVSGPGTGTALFADSSAAQTDVSFDVSGDYQLSVEVSDGRDIVSDTVIVTVQAPIPVNLPPSVDAGIDQVLPFPENVASLDAAAIDDGLPAGGSLILAWSAVSGSGTAAFDDASTEDPAVSFGQPGVYVLRLTADDGEASTADEVTVTVEQDPDLPETEILCTDGIDNDLDGDTDCADSDCAPDPACSAPATETQCTDNIDNDLDGVTDCDDSDCTIDPACAGATTLLSVGFSSSVDGFDYADNVLRFTLGNTQYANGNYDGAGGFNGSGGLHVALGGIDKSDIFNGMSGGWSSSFAVPTDSDVSITLRYRLVHAGNFDPGECSEALVAVNGVLLSSGASDFLEQVCGQGDGSPDRDTGWMQTTVTVFLPGGTHTITVGGYLNQKTTTVEVADIYVDDIEIVGVPTSAETECTDGIDNDLDGDTDCADSDCALDPACAPATETQCTDNLDNDLDSDTDCADSDCALDPACAGATILLSAGFDSSSDGFAYADNEFRGTVGNTLYENGNYLPSGGFNGSGGLHVALGGIDKSDIFNGMSGGWSQSFTVPTDSDVSITLRYRLIHAGNFDPGECSAALVAVNGVLLSSGASDFLDQVCGQGDGSPDQDTRWTQTTVAVFLPAGTHTITVGGYLNQKTTTVEVADIFIDDIEIVDVP